MEQCVDDTIAPTHVAISISALRRSMISWKVPSVRRPW